MKEAGKLKPEALNKKDEADEEMKREQEEGEEGKKEDSRDLLREYQDYLQQRQD